MAVSTLDKESKNGWSANGRTIPEDAGVSSLTERLHLHDKLRTHSRCDLETPASLIANVNIKQLLTPAAFDCLPTHYQNELIQLLPETDRISLTDGETPFAMTVNALSNEFFAKSCVEYRDRLRNGEFCIPPPTSSRTEVNPVVWDCDAEVLKQVYYSKLGIPKAGEPFICTSRKKTLLTRTVKGVKKASSSKDNKKIYVPKLKKPITSGTDSKSLLKTSKSLPVKTLSANVFAQKAVSKAKAVSNLKTREKESGSMPIAGVKRPRPDITSIDELRTSTSSDVPVQVSHSSSITSKQPNEVIITKFKKVTENASTGAKVTKVVPVVVRNPHGQVVTTLANCNPLLTQMIKRPVDSRTATMMPVKMKRKQNLHSKDFKRDNQVIVQLKSKSSASNSNRINQAVTEVISKVKSSREQHMNNGSSRPIPVIVTVNGSNGSLTSKLVSTAVNMERSKLICDSSKNNSPTLNLERSYQICKQVLGKAEGATIMVVGPGGKKKIISKPVRNRLADAAASNANSVTSSDIPIYRNKHRGKSTLTLSGHVFLAMKKDEDGYATKAYKRKTAFKQKPKKKLSKVSSKKTIVPVSASKPSEETSLQTTPSASLSSASNVTLVTPSLYATQPVVSVTENKSSVVKDTSLLDTCMCNKRALIMCSSCGAFCHAECVNKDLCLSCLGRER
ncbi:putative Polycomb group protein ASXL3 [Watersipora subatra]|uniref:putative Polycomb group protein ASXL3 n=1 Tax=Watersipora subatra TaxID=2589382 RepID=UPI00355BF02E